MFAGLQRYPVSAAKKPNSWLFLLEAETDNTTLTVGLIPSLSPLRITSLQPGL